MTAGESAAADELPEPDPEAFVHRMRAQRHASEKDLKIVITQRDSETGGGKTTLAVWLALCWDQHGWDGLEKGTTDPEAFLDTFPDLPKHSVMILDEAEELDARRPMKEENIEFSKKWMKMRTRQIDSILTLPTTTALDVRMLELADLRLHVTKRGECKVYRVNVDDRSREVDEIFQEFYSWPDVSETTAYQNLDKEKQEDLDQTAKEPEDLSPKEAAQLIVERGEVEEYIDTNHGGQRYIDKDAIGADYAFGYTESKQAKSALRREAGVDDDVL